MSTPQMMPDPSAPKQHAQQGRGAAPLPLAAFVVAALVCAASLSTANPELSCASVLVALLLARLLWRPGEPPVLLFAAGYQWLQVTTPVWYADYLGQSVVAQSNFRLVEVAIWLSLVGVAALALGMRFAIRRLPLVDQTQIDLQLQVYVVERVFVLYAATAAFALMLPYVLWQVLPLAQLLLAVANLKWAFYVLLGYTTLRQRRGLTLFAVATLMELVAGIGFFAEFKTVLFVALLVLLSARVRLTIRTLSIGVVTAAFLVVAGMVWMSVREDYRNYLSQGTGQQVILVSPAKQLSTFATMVEDVDQDELRGSVDMMFKRIAYVDFFAAALDYVPSHRPHEHGGLLQRAIYHVLVPRLLNPEKDVLESDSEETMMYTGLSVASTEQGTSIGMGYMAESYVDFGRYGMFVPIICFGVLWGAMYAYFIRRSPAHAVGVALSTALLINASQVEIAEVKLLGGMVMKFLVFALLLRFAIPKAYRWSTRRSMGRQPAARLAGAGAITEGV